MNMNANKTHSDRILNLIPSGLFFLFTFLFFLIFAPHIFYFQEKSSLFVFSPDFLKENLQQPGGLLVYISTLLTSFGYYPLSGSLITSGILLLILVTSSVIISNITSKSAGPLPYLIALSLFLLQCNYQYMFINNIGLLPQLVLFYMIIKKPGGWLPVILIPFWYYFTGGYAFIFLTMYLIWQITGRQPGYILRVGTLLLICSVTFAISSEFLFFQSNRNLLSFPWTAEGTGSQVMFFIFAVSLIVFLPLLSKIRIKNTLKDRLSPSVYLLASSIAIIALLTLIAFTKYDRKTYEYFKVEKLFTENKYQDVVDFNLRNPSVNSLTLYLNNLALCETGKLNDLLFNFQQSPEGGTLFLKWEIVSEILRRGCYFYYYTGMINEAHRWAFEYMVMKGLTPEGLKILIKTELINGNHNTAAKYNDILRKTIFYRKEAWKFDKLIFNDEAVSVDPELGPKRKIKVRRDFFSITDDPMIDIERVIASDSLNRQAFDYKIAWLLISKDYKGIANEWGNLGRYDYKSIPVHLEEAGVTLRNLYDIDLPVTGNLRISKVTEDRFIKFLQTFQSYGSNLQSAEPALRKQFGNTFWYYVFYK